MGRLLVECVANRGAPPRSASPAREAEAVLILLDEAHVLAAAESGLRDFLVARKYRVFVTLAAQGRRCSRRLPTAPARKYGAAVLLPPPPFGSRALSRDIFELLGTVWRKQVRPNEKLEDPLLTATEEIAWRTAELANLPTGAAATGSSKARAVQSTGVCRC